VGTGVGVTRGVGAANGGVDDASLNAPSSRRLDVLERFESSELDDVPVVVGV
jgi:hypothetical protein